MNNPPIVLMTLRAEPTRPERKEPSAFSFEWLQHSFGASVVRGGAIPLFVSNECPPEHLPEILARCDGLFLTGGDDVAPEYFNETDTVGNLVLHRDRDAIEVAAVAAADKLGMPILGVCRGAQVLNVARGGSIYQDLKQQYDGKLRDHSRGGTGLHVQSHSVDITPGSRLHDIAETLHTEGATSHHQAIRDLGSGLVVVARSPEDGVIEAVEEQGDRFIVAVQWHPEIHADDPVTLRLFAAFTGACRAYAARPQTTQST